MIEIREICVDTALPLHITLPANFSISEKLARLGHFSVRLIMFCFFYQVRDVRLIMDRSSRRSKGVG